MGSPIKAADIEDVGLAGDVCSRFRRLLQTRLNLKTLLEWLLDSAGNISDDAILTMSDRGAVPIGSIVLWAGSSMPSDSWLVCNGQNVSRTTYSTLYDRLGTSYGGGDGTTTFALPDLQSKFALGVGPQDPIATSGGLRNVTIAEGNLPAHSHKVKYATINVDNEQTGTPGTVASNNAVGTTASQDAFTSETTGGGESLDIRNPYLALYYIIKVK